MSSDQNAQCVKPISDASRALLREVRAAGGKMTIQATFSARDKALELKRAGYVQIGGKGYELQLTGQGQAYLDKLMRAH